MADIQAVKPIKTSFKGIIERLRLKVTHKAVVSTGWDALFRIPAIASRECLRAEPGAICSAAIITGPQLNIAAVIPQKRKVPVVVEAGCPIVLCLHM